MAICCPLGVLAVGLRANRALLLFISYQRGLSARLLIVAVDEPPLNAFDVVNAHPCVLLLIAPCRVCHVDSNDTHGCMPELYEHLRIATLYCQVSTHRVQVNKKSGRSWVCKVVFMRSATSNVTNYISDTLNLCTQCICMNSLRPASPSHIYA